MGYSWDSVSTHYRGMRVSSIMIDTINRHYCHVVLVQSTNLRSGVRERHGVDRIGQRVTVQSDS